VGRLLAFRVSGCATSPITEPYCDVALPRAARVADLIARLPLEAKVLCLDEERSDGCALDALGLPLVGAALYGEALHGLRRPCAPGGAGGAATLCPTSFPNAQLIAAAFDRDRVSAVATAIADEARGFFNAFRTGYSPQAWWAVSFFAPDINLCRDPRWGRCVEVPGEDPYLTGEYAMRYVRALQARDARGFVQAAANVKHVFAYDVEGGVDNAGARYSRMTFDAVMPQRDVVESYLPHFEAAVRGGGLMGAMCSYNAETYGTVNNTPSCANGHMLNGVMRGKFNFSGLVVSDCSAIAGIMNSHHFTATNDSTCAASIGAGVDLNCGKFWRENLAAAVRHGAVAEAAVDAALERVLAQAFELGAAEPDATKPFADIGPTAIDSPKHRALALDAARAGLVLLKNEKATLPLRADTRVAVLGPHFNASLAMLGNYYGDNLVVAEHTPLLALQRRADVRVVGAALGCSLDGNDTAGIAPAAALARSADVALVFLGLISGQGNVSDTGAALEREGVDRAVLTLPGSQLALVQAIVATNTPVVVVLIHSGGLAAEWVYAHADAVLDAFYPGELGGDAIAAVLMGDESPAGRLPTSIYAASFAAARSITDMQLAPHGATPGITHRYLAPGSEYLLFRFGFGLTYGAFSAAPAGATQLVATTDAIADAWLSYYAGDVAALPVASVAITNGAAGRASDYAVLGFARSRASGAPLRSLFGFERLTRVLPGARRVAHLAVPPQALASVDENGTQTIAAGVFDLDVGGEPDGFASFVLTITGPTRTIFELF
jgi:hypothetical protein